MLYLVSTIYFVRVRDRSIVHPPTILLKKLGLGHPSKYICTSVQGHCWNGSFRKERMQKFIRHVSLVSIFNSRNAYMVQASGLNMSGKALSVFSF